MLDVRQRWPRATHPTVWLVAGITVYCAFVAREAFWLARGAQDNDWPLLMWLARAGMQGDLSAFAVGHYGFLQLVLVRMLGPVCGGTLLAAKILNVASVFVSCIALNHALRSVDVRAEWRLAALCTFTLAYPTFVTSWAEFGDPLALASFASGLSLLFAAPSRRRLIAGGLLIGMAGLVRLHFQTMGWGTIVAFGGLEFSRRGAAPMKRVGIFGAAVLAAQAPVFVLNLTVHGTLFSPIAKTFIGQVLFGANEFDMASTYAAAPFDGLFSAHGFMLLCVLAERILDAPLLHSLLLIAVTLTLFRRDNGQPLRAFAVLLALGYYVGFVAPSWGITPRLLMGFMFLVALAVGLLGTWLEKWPRRSVGIAIALVIICAVLFRGERGAIRAQRNQARTLWERNRAITATIRAEGVTEPNQVFASDWFVYPTDDPEMIGYYNWGFWNLLVPAFAAERPNPYVAAHDPAAFEEFLADHGVRVMVLHAEPRVPAVEAIARGSYQPRRFFRKDAIADQIVYVRVEPQR